jgi:superfamily II DNA/RNA helicase
MTFDKLGLSQKTLDAVTASGFTVPTPIQAQAVPAAIAGNDVVGIAQTGTGKTASFILPMLTRLETGRARARMPRTLILEPTRELAAQVAEGFAQLGVNHKLNVALLIGGVSFDEQNRVLDRGADVLIATPGRLLDHYGRGRLLMTAVQILVIDEADRMLDMGFIPDIERILDMLPASRQTLFFSATMPKEVKKLADRFLKDPVRIEVSPPSSTAKNIVQKLKFTGGEPSEKRQTLRDLIGEFGNVKNAIIFCNRKRDVAILHKSLVKHGYNAGALHGDMEQSERTATLNAFRNGEILLLAASDVAARGLDIPAVSHIFNFDVPITPEDYVHRIGRTGRAGLDGFAATLVTARDLDAIKAIEKLSQQTIEWIGTAPSEEEIEEARKSRGRRGRGGKPVAEKSGGRPERRGAPAAKSNGKRPPSSSDNAKSKPELVTAGTGESLKETSAAASAPASNGHGASAPKGRNAPERKIQPRRREKDDPAVVGMGDHVPAFMLIPTRRVR